MRQKGKSQNGCYKKTKHTKCSEHLPFCLITDDIAISPDNTAAAYFSVILIKKGGTDKRVALHNKQSEYMEECNKL